MIKVDHVEVMVYRFPLTTPVQTSFGLMENRPMVVVKLTTDDGIVGWGEIWCNFPNIGAEHRARLTQYVFAPILKARSFASPEDAFDEMTNSTWILGLQTGEIGPLAQSIAGIEIALTDIAGKQKNMPIWKMFGGNRNSVPVYASGINPILSEVAAASAIEAGYNALKLKIGFGLEKDISNLTKLRSMLGEKGILMADANQAWTADQAIKMLVPLTEFGLLWLEEPIAADRPISEWQAVKQAASMLIAAGENIHGEDNYGEILQNDILDVVQPDIAKWGGLSKTIQLARRVIDTKKLYCPHYLGGGIGLVASAHALAAAGGEGMLEVDINPNPLRSELVGNLLNLKSGMAKLGNDPGLGIEPDLKPLSRYQVL